MSEQQTQIDALQQEATTLRNEKLRMEQELEKTTHIQRVLQAIRKINQLIVSEHEPQQLIAKACDSLTHSLGYYNAWVVLHSDDANEVLATAASGFGKNTESWNERLQGGYRPKCMEQALLSPQTVVITDPMHCCENCIHANEFEGRAGFARRLQCEGESLGVIVVSIPLNYARNRDEQELFEELANDLAFAMQRIKTSKKLNTSIRRYREIFEGSRDGLVMMDANGHIIDANQGFCDMLGYTLDELKHASIQQITPSRWHVWEVEEIWGKRLASENYSGTYEKEHTRKDGSVFPVEYRVYRVCGERGAVEYIWGIVRDITTRKQQENRIALLGHMLDDSPASITVHDTQGKFLFANKRTVIMHGYSTEQEFLSINLHDLDVPESEQKIHENLKAISENKEAMFEATHFRKDGSTFPMQILAKHIDWQGTPAILSIGLDVSELKKTREALQESEERYRLLSDMTMEGILLHKNGISIDMNSALLEMLGYSRDDLLGKDLFAYIHEDDIPIVRSKIQEDHAKPYQLRVKKADGDYIWVEVEANNFLENGDMWRVTSVRDITERRKQEQALRESEALFRTLYKNLPGGMILIDRNYKIINVNQRTCDITGYRREDLIGQLCDRICPKGSASKKCPIWAENQQGFEGMDTNVKCHDGSFNPILKNARRVLVNGNEHILEVFQDIREQKETEAALRESEQRYKSLINASFGGIAIHDNGVILACNHGLSVLTGYSDEELVGIDGLMLLDDSSRPLVVGKIQSGYEKPYEAVGIRKNGEKYPLRIESRNIPYKGKMVRTTEFRDMTESKRAEEEHKKLEEQLHQAQKMESVGRLAGGVAHDFNNMLSVILGYSELILSHLQIDDTTRSYIEEVKNAADRSAVLTQQLLAFARKQTISPKVLNLNNTIKSMLNMLKRLIGENIELVWNPADTMLPVRIDPSQIDQLLANLLVNARDAIGHHGGRITIETSMAIIDESYCTTHGDFTQGEYVVTAVSDSGCGMDQKTIQSIFEPFFTTKKMGEGTGLGLATVYGIIKQNCGFVNVYSEVGKGTTFRIYLPVYKVETDDTHADASAKQPLQRGRETVLIVEDEASILAMTKVLLERLGYNVLATTKPREAIRIAAANKNTIHLLLTDVVMPHMNGRDLAQNIREVQPGIKCLFMSGYTANVIAHHGVLDKGVHFIQKPFSQQQLSKKMREALED